MLSHDNSTQYFDPDHIGCFLAVSANNVRWVDGLHMFWCFRDILSIYSFFGNSERTVVDDANCNAIEHLLKLVLNLLRLFETMTVIML